MSDNDSPQVTENKTNIEGIKHEMGQVWEVVQELRAEVKEALIQALRRPGWVVTLIISILLSACVGLIVRAANHGG